MNRQEWVVILLVLASGCNPGQQQEAPVGIPVSGDYDPGTTQPTSVIHSNEGKLKGRLSELKPGSQVVDVFIRLNIETRNFSDLTVEENQKQLRDVQLFKNKVVAQIPSAVISYSMGALPSMAIRMSTADLPILERMPEVKEAVDNRGAGLGVPKLASP